MTEHAEALLRTRALIVAARHRWRDPEVVVRWVDRPAPTPAAVAIPALVPRDPDAAAGLGMRLDRPFAPGSTAGPGGWSAPGRLVSRHRRPLRPFRVVVAVNPWSRTEVELQIAPRSRRALRRWSHRRQERFWGLAHDAADRLARELAPEGEGRATLHRRAGRAPTVASEWDDASCTTVHPMFLPAGGTGGDGQHVAGVSE